MQCPPCPATWWAVLVSIVRRGAWRGFCLLRAIGVIVGRASRRGTASELAGVLPDPPTPTSVERAATGDLVAMGPCRSVDIERYQLMPDATLIRVCLLLSSCVAFSTTKPYSGQQSHASKGHHQQRTCRRPIEISSRFLSIAYKRSIDEFKLYNDGCVKSSARTMGR